MKKLLIIPILFITSIAYGQYVAQTLQQRIQNDQVTINQDLAQINAMQADINSIVNDQSASSVTADVQDVQNILASQTVSTTGPGTTTNQTGN